MKKTILILGLLMALASSASCYYGQPEQAIEFVDKEFQAQLIQGLEKKGVQFRIDDNQRIWYQKKDQDLVFDVMYNTFPQSKSDYLIFNYAQAEYLEMLKQKLDKAGIQYAEEVHQGKKMIRLDYKEEVKWRPIKTSIDELIIETNRKKLSKP